MSVTVNLGNGAVSGAIATADGAIGIIMTGATEGNATVGTPFLVTNAAEIAALGLTQGNNPLAVKIFAEIVAETKAQGVNTFEIYVQLLADTVTVDDMVDVANSGNAVELVNYANGKIKILAAITDDTLVYPSQAGLDTDDGINADCYTAITKLHALCVSFAALPKNWAMRGIIGCTSYNGTAGDLTDLTANSTNRVMAFIGDTESGDGCSLGILIGRLISIPVQRKVSRVLNGAVSNTTAFIGTVSADQYTTTSAIEAKGFVTFKQITGKNGFFFTSDNMCCATTDDYRFMCRGRVVDKAHRIIVSVYNDQIDNEVDTNDDGTIDANSAKQLQTAVETSINVAMTSPQNVKSVSALVSTSQNVTATGQIDVAVELKGRDYSSSFNVTLGYQPTT